MTKKEIIERMQRLGEVKLEKMSYWNDVPFLTTSGKGIEIMMAAEVVRNASLTLIMDFEDREIEHIESMIEKIESVEGPVIIYKKGDGEPDSFHELVSDKINFEMLLNADTVESKSKFVYFPMFNMWVPIKEFDLGMYVKNAIDMSHMTQKEVAEKISINYGTFKSKLSRGQFDSKELIALASLLNLDLNALLGQ